MFINLLYQNVNCATTPVILLCDRSINFKVLVVSPVKLAMYVAKPFVGNMRVDLGSQYVFMPQKERQEFLGAIGVVDEVMVTRHPKNPQDMSVCRELLKLRPDVFANGGDRFAEDIPEFKLCKELGIKVSAFYILGYEGDTKETVRNTINYAIKLNTPLARFAISTPYPGTGFYEQLKKEGRILTDDYEKYTQFNLVYRHKNLSQEEVKDLLEEALRKYYFRPSYFLSMLKLKIKWLF